MQPRPSFDRVLLIPVLIGIVSILGICWIFLTSGLAERFLPPTATPSSIRSFEPATRTPSPSATFTQEEAPPTATATSPDAYPGPFAKTLPSPTPSPFITKSLPAPSATPTPENMQPLPVGRYYDDVDPNIAYDPYWTALKNPGTENAYHGTLHVSENIGDEASFRFTGKRFRLGYQRGRNFGTVTVIVDDQQFSFHEQAFDLVWSSPKLSPGDHFVRIIHESGESINLDYILIVD